jgi:hypothetical protein
MTMKIKPLKIKWGMFKVTVGADHIRDAFKFAFLEVDWPDVTAYLIRKGIPDEYAKKASEQVKKYLSDEIDDAVLV